ncbi:MAG TPA: response regulator transcription factor [Acidimicrobiales bacterium]|nr:response regulator transcription factor [Acidimicrobiales bacterium]
MTAGGATTIRVLVADDQAMIRAGLRMILDNEPDLAVVAEAADGLAAVEAAASARPDVVLMDVRMPLLDGLEATRRIVASSDAPPRMIVLTTFDDDEYLFEALRAGASGFLLKDVGPDPLIEAIHTVARHESLLAPAVTRRVIERYVELDGAAAGRSGPTPMAEAVARAGLTDREREVLVGLAAGWSNTELAAELYLSEATVKTHVSSLLAKLGLRSRVQAVIAAYESGLVHPGDGRFGA